MGALTTRCSRWRRLAVLRSPPLRPVKQAAKAARFPIIRCWLKHSPSGPAGSSVSRAVLPITLEGQCIGAVGVSGAPAAVDRQIGQAGIDAFNKA